MVTYGKTRLVRAVAIVALAGIVAGAGARQKPGTVRLDANRTLGRPQVFRNLTVIPVYSRTAKATNTYITLDEGLANKSVTVQESKSGGSVNTLYVTNSSNKPLYLMGGEVVLGGQQDRTLGRDTIVASGQKEVPITVFCVEHGRWTGKAQFDETAQTVASAQIRANAQNGEFYASRPAATAQGTPAPGGTQSAARVNGYRNSAMAGRVNSVGEAQQQVWEKVASKNAKLKTENSSGSYRRALNLAGGDAQKSVPAYVAALANSLGSDSHLVGVVAAVNGKIIAADMFGDPGLFKKLWPKLLRSYASDAVENFPSDPKKMLIANSNQAKEFLITATDAKSKIENKSDISSTVRYESSQSVTFSLVPAPKAGGALGRGGLGGAAAGDAVHTGVLGK